MNRKGSLLVVTMALIVVLALTATSFMHRAVFSSRMGGWSRDHLTAQLLAESAVEELFASVSDSANTPGDPVFTALRTARPGVEVVLPGLAAPLVEQEARGRSGALGGAVRLRTSVRILKVAGSSADPAEVAGVLRFEAAVHVDRQRRPLVEKVRVDRSFQVARVVLPAALERVALFVTRPDHKKLPPRAMSAPAAADDRTLLAMLTRPAPVGFQRAPAELVQSVAACLAGFAPGAIGRRAQFVTRSVSELAAFLGGRFERGRPVNGVILSDTRELIDLSIERFSGRAVLCARGPVRVGDITVEQPGRDSLTIVAAERLVVTGNTVQANLLTLNPAAGVVFGAPVRVTGAVVSSRFPRFRGITVQEMERCEFGSFDEPAPADPMAAYFVTLSTRPVSAEHLQEGEAWTEW